MARRRSLNRRWSRRSLNGTGILNDDSNIVDDEDPLWWKKIENNPNSIRPSGRFTISESSSTVELNPDSALNDTEASGEWWDVLQKTSQDLVPKKINKDNSKASPKPIIISNTSDSDTDDRLHQAKKRKVNFRRTRKSLGKNAFLQALDTSEPAVESEPILSQNSHVTRTSFQSLDELPPRRTRQQSKNDSISSHNSNSSDTEKIRKRRPTLFKKPRGKMSNTAFDDVLEADESVIAPSQVVDIVKSSGKSNIRSSGRSRSTILKPLNDQTSLSQNDSLNQSKESNTKSSNRRTKNGSLELKSKPETSQSTLPSPVNPNRRQSQISESDNDSEKIVSQPRTNSTKMDPKRSIVNSIDNTLSDNEKQSREISRKKSTKHSDSTSSILNKDSKNDQSDSLTLHFSPPNSESTSNNDAKSREIARSNISIPDQLLSKRSKTYESDGSSTTSISEELKIGNPSQRLTTQEASPVPANKMNVSLNASISNEILQDWESDDSDGSGSPEKSDPKISNISGHSALTEKNDDSRQPRMSTIESYSQSEHHTDEHSSNKETLKNYPTRNSTKRPLDQSLSNKTAQKSIIQSVEKRGRSGKIPVEESETSEGEIMTKRLTEKRSQSQIVPIEESETSEGEVITESRSKRQSRYEKLPVEESNTDNVEISVDPSTEKPSQEEIEISDEEIITNKSTRNRSMKISDEESSSSDEGIFNTRAISNRSASHNQTEAELEENNNEGLDLAEKSPKTPVRRSRRTSRKTPNIFKKSSTHNSKADEKNTEAVDESDSDGEISRDPSAYELPDMNRSDSVTLSDSDDENELPNDENPLGNHTPANKRSLATNRSPEKKPSPAKNRSAIKNKKDTSKISIDNTSIQPSEPLPSTSGIRKELPARKSSINPSGRKSNKSNISSNQRSILNYLTPHSPRPVQHEPLPTEDEVHDFREKLKTVTIERDKQKESHKKEMEKELEEMRMKLANQKNSNIKKVQKKMAVPKNSKNQTKAVDKAFIVNGKVYKQPKLPRPKHWATDRLYKYLWKKMEPKFKLETRIRSEKFIIELSNVVTIVMRRKKYENYKVEVDTLMNRMARLGIIKTRNDFYHFCYDFLPYEFRAKVTPILLPGNKHTIPFDPAIINIPLIGG